MPTRRVKRSSARTQNKPAPAGAKLIRMAIRPTKRRQTERLRNVVDCLPYDTRLAMLAGLDRYDRIIVGAYTDRKGGVCPMLAAHRCGGRTDFSSFARAWDRFTGAGSRARSASERELRTLRAQLEASLWRDDDARAEVTGATMPPALAPPEIDVPEPPREHRRLGASWLRPFRRWDGYSDAVAAAIEQAEGEAEATVGQTESRPAPPRESTPPPREPAGSR